MPWRSTHRVATRYIAPVSRYLAPRCSATARETVDLPVPEGPSMASSRASAAVDSFMFRLLSVASVIYSPTALYSEASSARLSARSAPGVCSPSWTVWILVRTRRSTG